MYRRKTFTTERQKKIIHSNLHDIPAASKKQRAGKEQLFV